MRVTSTDTFATTVLPGILARIAARAEAPPLELLTSNRHLDFARLHADITLRPAERLPDDVPPDAERSRGVDVSLLGRATWDEREGGFTELELIAA